jgi:adenine-specific DNA-methyltransferase
MEHFAALVCKTGRSGAGLRPTAGGIRRLVASMSFPAPTPPASPPSEPAENPGYRTGQLITCLGNKRALLPHIDAVVAGIRRRLGNRRLRCLDAFSGSGAVSRLLKGHAEELVSNDQEDYAAVLGRCHLANRRHVDERSLADCVAELNARVDRGGFPPGFIEELYAPRDEARIGRDERVFYTRRNARRIDDYRRLIDAAPAAFRDLLLGPLLSAASIHANTAGVFKGFYKNRDTGIGQFGGTGGDALARIRGTIELAMPVLSAFDCPCTVMQRDANEAVRLVRGLDLAYFDPPYNQHPYGSNYFMLNLIVNYRRPERISRVSGIPADWRRSGYNVRARAGELLADLVGHTDAAFLLVSFNDEGFLSPAEMHGILGREGAVEVVEIPYATFRGSRNLRSRSPRVTERLFLVER